MKKSKILAVLSALTMTAISSVPTLSSAVVTPPENVGTFEELINAIDPETAYIEYDNLYDNSLCILFEDNRAYSYKEWKDQLYVTVKDGTKLDVDKIKSSNTWNSLGFQEIDDNTYLITNCDESKKEFIDTLIKEDNVVSIDYGTAMSVIECFIDNMFIDSSLSNEEIENKYLLKYHEYKNSDEETVKYYYVDEDKNTWDKFYGNCYQIVRDIQNDENVQSLRCNFSHFDIFTYPSLGSRNFTENLYTAEIKGDVNADGNVDIADVVAISAYTGNAESNSFRAEQQVINGDVHNTGDGLTANDALMIQQYIAGMIDSLE